LQFATYGRKSGIGRRRKLNPNPQSYFRFYNQPINRNRNQIKKMKNKAPIFSNKQGKALAKNVNDLETIAQALAAVIAKLPDTGKANTWVYHFRRLLAFIVCGFAGKAPFSIFRMDGNKKLPFCSFSSLPGIDCPGAGACLQFCYSFKAWRYPAAYCRQMMNSLVQRFAWARIESAFLALPFGIRVRLFVDGDFSSAAILRQWMELVARRPDLQVYGYTKSWALFVDLYNSGFEFPENYILNQSSGSKYPAQSGIAIAFAKLPITRGTFNAVKVNASFLADGTYQSKRNPRFKEYQKEARAAAKALGFIKIFVCPGACGDCLSRNRHACGERSFDGVAIIIAEHG
jgi:hypothetical protein